MGNSRQEWRNHLKAVWIGIDIDFIAAGPLLDAHRVFQGLYIAFKGRIARRNWKWALVLMKAGVFDILSKFHVISCHDTQSPRLIPFVS